ncbi:hypothetical protein ACFLRI_00140 [Bacteroidota bacterium]
MIKKIVYLILMLSIGIHQSKAQNPEKELYLESIGIFSSQNIYLSYVYLGNLSDGYMYKALSRNFVEKLINEQIAFMQESEKQYIKLAESVYFDESGKAILQAQAEIMKLIQEQAAEFLKYIESGESKYVESYEIKRLASWEKISTLLGLEGQP